MEPPTRLRVILAVSVCIAAAIALQTLSHTNLDVSWLLYVAERVLDGARPYGDFLEVNPPASIFIYLPAVVLARLTGLRPEVMTDGLVCFGTVSSLALCGSILARAKVLDGSRLLVVSTISCVTLLILPLNSFAQRDHIAVLAILPMLASLAARIAGQRPVLWHAVLAGLGGGIAIAVKPVFGLALMGPALYLVVRQSWRSIPGCAEAWIACCVVAAYSAAVVEFCPDFVTRVLPLLANIYIPVRLPFLDLITSTTVWIWLALICCAWRSRSSADVACLVLMLGSAGFELAFLIQGKGFPYHSYPAIALAALAWSCATSEPTPRVGSTTPPVTIRFAPPALALMAALLVFGEDGGTDRDAPELTQAIAAISPHPRLLMIGADMRFGRVFARDHGGEWVGSLPAAWIICYALSITPTAEEDPRFAEAIRMERELYARDVATGRPDVILIDGDGWLRWTRHSVALVAALDAYRMVGRYRQMTIWSRAAAPRNGVAAAAT